MASDISASRALERSLKYAGKLAERRCAGLMRCVATISSISLSETPALTESRGIYSRGDRPPMLWFVADERAVLLTMLSLRVGVDIIPFAPGLRKNVVDVHA